MKKIDVLRLLKEQGFRYVFFHPNGRIAVSTHKPKLNPMMKCWDHEDGSTLILIGFAPPELGDWRDSVHELDFGDSKQDAEKPLFEVGDVVYVLSHSNNGAFGVSSKGEIASFQSGGKVEVVIGGVAEFHKIENISFSPFSIHKAGFSQVRPKPEPKAGDWGWFWDDDDALPIDGLRYGVLQSIAKEGHYYCFNGCFYDNFSLENPTQKHD